MLPTLPRDWAKEDYVLLGWILAWAVVVVGVVVLRLLDVT